MPVSRLSQHGAVRSDRWRHRARPLRGLGALALLGAVVGSVVLVAPQAVSVAAAAEHAHAVPAGTTVQRHDVPGFPGTSTTAPFNECPAIGWDNSCGVLIVVTNNGTQILQDPNNGVSSAPFTSPGVQTPYDDNDDTLVGVVNDSTKPIFALQLSGEATGTDLFGFEGDGICTYALGGASTNGNSVTGGTPLPGPGGTRVTSTARPPSSRVVPRRADSTPTGATTRVRTTRSRTSAPTPPAATSTSRAPWSPAVPPTSRLRRR